MQYTIGFCEFVKAVNQARKKRCVMFFSKQIVLPSTKDETLKLLQTYADRIRPPHRGKVTGDRFRFLLTERHTRSHWRNGLALIYGLTGSVQQKNSESIIDYCVSPGVTNLFFGGCLLIVLLSSIYHLLSGANNLFVVGISSCALVLFFLWNVWEARQCAAEFEQYLMSQSSKE